MPLQVFGFLTHPHAFAVTKADVTLDECVFLLDFSRPIERLRWLGIRNKWIGVTTGLLVPVVHQGEQHGGYVFGLHTGEPHFKDMQALWREHRGAPRSMRSEPVEPIQLIADFANHFSEDC